MYPRSSSSRHDMNASVTVTVVIGLTQAEQYNGCKKAACIWVTQPNLTIKTRDLALASMARNHSPASSMAAASSTVANAR